MNKQDIARPRNFEDILYRIEQVKKNVKTNVETLTKINNELNNFMTSTLKQVTNLQTQIDGKVMTWYYEGIPTLENQPANNWNDKEKETHIGDLYYDRNTGYTYIFEYSNEQYMWKEIVDKDLKQALALANAAQDTADSKRRIFIEQPSPPYDNGDLWIKNEEIYICQISKSEGQEYQEQDFINNLKYTDNTVANAIIDELGGTTTKVLQGQVVTITSGFAKFTDLSDPNSSTTIAGENITTGSIKSQNYIENQSGTKIDLEDGTIDTKNFKVDEDGNVNLENGATVISEKGLMNTYTYDTKGFKIVGFIGDDIFSPTKANKESVTIDFIIPEGLNITKAFVYLFHTPMYWGTNNSSVWGWCRNLKLYKTNNMYSRQIVGEYFGGYNENDNTTYDEITGAFGTNGFTAQTASDSSHITEKTVSEDISEVLKDESGNTISGLHQLRIESDFNFTEELTQENISSKTGFVFAVLRIDGFMTYENLKSKEIMTENNINIVSEDNKNIITEGL